MSFTNREAQIVLGMVARGDKRHDIAAWFGENQARVAEVEAGAYGNLTMANVEDLPPKGAVGPKAQRLRGGVSNAIKQLEQGDSQSALDILKAAITKFNRNEA
nr:hypothetical protein [Amylibacter sp.]